MNDEYTYRFRLAQITNYESLTDVVAVGITNYVEIAQQSVRTAYTVLSDPFRSVLKTDKTNEWHSFNNILLLWPKLTAVANYTELASNVQSDCLVVHRMATAARHFDGITTWITANTVNLLYFIWLRTVKCFLT